MDSRDFCFLSFTDKTVYQLAQYTHEATGHFLSTVNGSFLFDFLNVKGLKAQKQACDNTGFHGRNHKAVIYHDKIF